MRKEKKTPAEMVAMNRFLPDRQAASTPLATKVAGESPRNLLRGTDQHLNNPLVGKPVDGPEVMVERWKVNNLAEKFSPPVAQEENSKPAVPVTTADQQLINS